MLGALPDKPLLIRALTDHFSHLVRNCPREATAFLADKYRGRNRGRNNCGGAGERENDVRDNHVMAVSMSWPQYLRCECTVTGFSVKLTEYEAEALMFLMLRCPNSVSKEELIEWLWPDPGLEPEFTESMVYQTMRRLRAKVGEFHIPSRVNFGYRLMQQPEPLRGRERGKRGACTVFQQAA